MNHESLPIVDFSGMLGDEPSQRMAVANEVDRYAREVGFLYLKNFGIAAETFSALRASARRFFSAPSVDKQRFAYRQDMNFGYHSIGTEGLDPSKPKDQKESFTMRDASRIATEFDLWPSSLFQQVAVSFYEDCRRLSSRLMEAFALALDLEPQFFTPLHSGLTQTLRFLHYPPAEATAAGQMGAGAHTDYGTLTLLYQDDSGGLEVQKDNGQWIPAPPVPGTIVVNTGDLLSRWTNDQYRSTPHRVQVRPAAAQAGRLSIAFFSDPDPDVLVETLASCQSQAHPSKYPPITAREHIEQKIAATN